ncbi:MAG: papain-like cysteine protease family protein [Cyanobacteria bacterium P01_A01_bin.45]
MPTPTLGGASSVLVNFPEIIQEQSEWCWAACIQMVLKYVDNSDSTTQCKIVSQGLGISGCCNNLSSSICNKPLQVPKVKEEWEKNGFSSIYNEFAIQFPTVVNEINQGRPIEIGWKYNGPGGHALLIVGYDKNNEKLFVNDPRLDGYRGYVDYSEVVSAFGEGSWEWTWTGIKRGA